MGGGESKEQTEARERRETERRREMEERMRKEMEAIPMTTAWRRTKKDGDLEWTESEETTLREKCLSLVPFDLRRSVVILVLGTTGAGKSAFLNSLISALCDCISAPTFSGKSILTTTNALHVIDDYNGNSLPFKLIDLPGVMENELSEKIYDELLSEALKGQVRPYFEIRDNNKGEWIAVEPNEALIPSLVVIVLRANREIHGHLRKRIDDVIKKAGISSVDVVAVLTCADLTSADEKYPIKNDAVRYMFQSRSVQKAVQSASNSTGLPEGQIYPVTNYTDATHTQNKMNILHLFTLQTMLHAAIMGARKRKARAKYTTGIST